MGAADARDVAQGVYRRFIMKKKILFIIDVLAGGGAQRALINILENMDPEKFACELAVIKRSTASVKFESDKIKVHYLDLPAVRKGFFRLRKTIKKVKPDIVFSTVTYVNELVCLATRLMFKRPCIVMRSATLESENNQEEPKLVRMLAGFAYSRADCVVVMTNAMKNEMVDIFRIDEERVKVIPNMVNIDAIQAYRNEQIEEDFFNKRESAPSRIPARVSAI